MNGLTFAEPWWFWGAGLLIPLFVLRLWAHLRAGGRLPGLVSPRLAHRLINGATQSRRWAIFSLQALALFCLFAALARPQLGFEEIESETEARNLLIAIDTSRSMLSDDLPPDRLSRTKLAAKDIVLSLPDDRIGLIAFAGKPFLQAPLTVDHEAILESIDQLDTEIIPRGGTNLSAAVTLAIETVEEAKLGPSALVLFSDGEALEGLDEVENVRDRAEKAGLKLLTVGVGTSGGSIIPAVNEDGEAIPGEFVKDETGQVVRTRLTPESLQALAAKGGIYSHLGGGASLTDVVARICGHLAATREEAGTQRRPIERFLWPLGTAFGLLVLSHLLPLFWLKPARATGAVLSKRGVMAALVFLPSFCSSQLLAESVSGVAAKAKEAMEANERALAEESSPRQRSFLQMQIGAQAYRAGDFERAAEAFGHALVEGHGRYDSTALYNLGNTLFRKGETALSPRQNPDQIQSLTENAGVETTIRDWEGAIEHFESSLALEPGNQMTAHNLEYVRKRLEELKQQKEQQEQEQQQEQKEEDNKEQEDPQKQDQKQDEKKDDNSSSQDSSSDNQDPQKDPGKDGQDPQSPGQTPPDPPKDPSDSPKDPQNPGEDRKDDSADQQPQPESPENPQDPKEAPSDGKLEANPNEAQPSSPGQANSASQAEQQKNPDTGYAPTEARQLLDALADETEVRPLLAPSRGEKFKNW